MGNRSSKTDNVVHVLPQTAKNGTAAGRRDKENPLCAHEGAELPREVHQRRGVKFQSLSVRTISLKSGSEAASRPSRSAAPTTDATTTQIRLEAYDFPFENIVFQGGGTKGIAHAGAVRVFEKAGLWPQIRRLAGASAGAMWAILLGVGYNSYDVEEFLSLDLRKYFLDASCGTLIPNVIKHYGWHPASRLYSWFGDRLENATGLRDITFQQLYDRFKTEVCIVVTNVNVMDAEYCHVKTTPNMSVRTAMRMSMAIPGLFCAVKYKRYGREDLYVDGGLLCNYPIHCFDGWWLSMKPEDSFLQRLQPLENAAILMQKNRRFAPLNDKTIGVLLYSSDEQDLMVNQLTIKNAQDAVQRPNTKLARKRKDVKFTQKKYKAVTQAMSKFIAVLSESQLDSNTGTVSKKELEAAFAKKSDDFTEEHTKILFGENFTIEEVFEYLDCNNDGEISFGELMGLAEQKGIGLQSYFQGYKRRDITSLRSFLGTLSNTLLINVKRVFTTEGDLERTVGIDTLYVSATDFKLEEDDRNFLVQQGERAAKHFLIDWIARNPEKAVRKQHVPPAPGGLDLPNGRRESQKPMNSADASRSLPGVPQPAPLEVAPAPKAHLVVLDVSDEDI